MAGYIYVLLTVSFFCSLQNNDGCKKKKKKKNKNSDTQLFTNAGGTFYGENVFSQEKSSLIPENQSSSYGDRLQNWKYKQRSSSLGTSDYDRVSVQENKQLDYGRDIKGTKDVMKKLTKKPPVAQGTKISPKLVAKNGKTVKENGVSKCNGASANESGVTVKGHRRQRSLPKQHYTTAETVGYENSYLSNTRLDPWCNGTNTNSASLKRGEMRKSVSLPETVPTKPRFKDSTACNGCSIDTGLFNGCRSFDEPILECSDVRDPGYYNGHDFNGLNSNHLPYMSPIYDIDSVPSLYGVNRPVLGNMEVTDTFSAMNGHTKQGEDQDIGSQPTESHSKDDVMCTDKSNKNEIKAHGNWRKIFGMFK